MKTVVELNHDFCPDDRLLLEWAKAMQAYMRSGDRDKLPFGVTLLSQGLRDSLAQFFGPSPLPGAEEQ